MKKICVFLCMTILLSFFHITAFADEYDFLTLAQSVKEKVDVPENYTDFNSYVDVGDSVNYVLSWSGGNTNDGGVLTVVTDSKNRIIGLSQYKYGKYQGNYKLSSIDYNEACSIAEKYLEKIAPEFADSFALFPQPNYIARNNESYSVVFYRYENEIPCYDNYAVLLVDAYTKQVSEYQAVWEDYVRISPKGKYITEEEALKSYNKHIGIQLGYSNCNDEIKLLYSTNQDGTKFVSAYNGSIINTNIPPYQTAEKYRKKTYFKNSLTEVLYEDNEGLETLDRKIRNNQYFALSQDYVIADVSYLTDDGENTFAEVVYMSKDKQPVTVVINTVTFEIAGFSSPREVTEISRMLTDQKCLNIAKDFAYQHIKTLYKKCKTFEKIEIADNNIYRVKFQLIKNGIPYYDNGIIIDVDRADGRVVSVETRVDENVDFPLSIADVTYDKAYDVLINEIGFEIQYVPVMTQQGKELIAVYSFTPIYPVYVCGDSGMLCDIDGNVYRKPVEKVYNDISGIASENQIKTVSLAGIMNYEGDSFNPSQYITAYEFTEIVYNVFGEFLEFDDYGRYITHEEAVAKLVRVLGYGDIANFSDTYMDVFIDSASINPEYKGHAAIAKAIGIINGNALLPKEYVTRSYCAELIYNTITDRSERNDKR